MSISMSDALEMLGRFQREGNYICIDRAMQIIADQTECADLFMEAIQRAGYTRRTEGFRALEVGQ